MKFDLIVVSSGFSNVPDGAFILPPDGDGTYDVGDHVSYSVSVEAPEGFEVAQTIYGEWKLWSPDGSAVDIFVQDRKHGQEIGIVYEAGGSFVTKYARIVDGSASFIGLEE